jgi:hypothetical protein
MTSPVSLCRLLSWGYIEMRLVNASALGIHLLPSDEPVIHYIQIA